MSLQSLTRADWERIKKLKPCTHCNGDGLGDGVICANCQMNYGGHSRSRCLGWEPTLCSKCGGYGRVGVREMFAKEGVAA